MAQFFDKEHPRDANGNSVSLSTWCEANLSDSDLATYRAADKAYLAEIESAGMSWDHTDGQRGQITFPDTEEAFWASTPERTTIWNNLNVFLTQYKNDTSLTW